jgi:hypothetical protein
VNDLTPKQHVWRAALGISAGIALAIIPAAGMYFDKSRRMAWLWILLVLASLPMVGWGAAHLARSRGYPGAGGCGLCIAAYLVSGFVGTTSPYPLAFGIGIVFIALLPTVVLLSLPNKLKKPRRRRHRVSERSPS